MKEYEFLVDYIFNGFFCEKKDNVYIIRNEIVKYIWEKEIIVYFNLNLNIENEVWWLVWVEVLKICEYEVGYFDC